MARSSISFVLFFTALLIYARCKEYPGKKIQQKGETLKGAEQIMEDEPKQEKIKVIRMKVTGYCPCKICCGKFADGFTSTGKNAWRTDGVAADLRILPYGTKLVIPGIGIRVVDDTGDDMRRSAKMGICHIDVRFRLPDGTEDCPEERKKCHQRAREFGVQWKDVVVLDPAG